MRKPTSDEIEVAETLRIAKSLKRLIKISRFGSNVRARRALSHAILMAELPASEDHQAAIREALRIK